ncbi:heme-binding protein [Streptomyces sp. NPDC057854]|uniref:heme-binding protein n=1 Tax=Streptomyces sp. NPDC057854 TaxID=3346264 RepID=UPI0036B33464
MAAPAQRARASDTALDRPVLLIAGGISVHLDDRLVGAIGVDGGTLEQDHSFAAAAVDALAERGDEPHPAGGLRRPRQPARHRRPRTDQPEPHRGRRAPHPPRAPSRDARECSGASAHCSPNSRTPHGTCPPVRRRRAVPAVERPHRDPRGHRHGPHVRLP